MSAIPRWQKPGEYLESSICRTQYREGVNQMPINVDYPDLLALFPEYLDPKRSESASFLIWYLENYSRLDPSEAEDAVCDQPGDHGVDGIVVNDNDQTITVYQSRISQSSDKTIGDSALKTFAGTLLQFKDADSIQAIIDSAKDVRLGSLVHSLDLVNKIATHEVRGEFLSNIDIDGNGDAFLKHAQNITFVGKSKLVSTHISGARELPIHTPADFDIAGFHVTEYVVDAQHRAVIAPIKATELVALEGIADQSLFTFNVRGPLGGTRVNRDIVTSIKNAGRHKFFPLFHNGIIVIARTLNVTSDKLSASDYFVVNGCQSLTALYENRKQLTSDLRILTKFIQMDPNSEESEMVTRYSNNQNGVRARDFMANNKTQIRLQNEFGKDYASKYAFEIKRGEQFPAGVQVISNETAGLYLMAFDLKLPWATHRKYQVFEDQHADLFGRHEVTADRVIMLQQVIEAIREARGSIQNTLVAKYILTQYLILYLVRVVLENDPLFKELITKPARFVRTDSDRAHFKQCVRRIVDDIIIHLNAELKGYGDSFDYRDKLRDEDWVRDIEKKITGIYLTILSRHLIPSFSEEWAKATVGPAAA